MSSRKHEVLVVGAGPTGLTLACSLARSGVDVAVVDQLLEPSRAARANGYMTRSLEIFHDLGVIEQALSAPPARDVSASWDYVDGKRSPRRGPAANWKPSDEDPYPMMQRQPTWRVEGFLRDRLAGLGITVEYGRRVVALEQDDESVDVTIARMTEGSMGWGHSLTAASEEDARGAGAADGADTEVLRARYVVGCDGGQSTVRKIAGFTFEHGDAPDWVGFLAEVQVDGLPNAPGTQMASKSDGRLVMIEYIPASDVFQVHVRVLPDVEGNYPTDFTLEEAQRAVDEVMGAPFRLHSMTWKSLYRVRDALADRYRNGRVFIAGDAAHLCSPVGGQGANTGVSDGYNLGWKLAHVVKGWAPEELLDTYESERRPVGERIVRTVTSNHREASREGAPPLVGSEGRPAWFNLKGFEPRVVTGLAIGYPDSPLSGGDRLPEEPSTGDRAPDGKLVVAASGAERRLFDVYEGYHYTLLLFGEGLGPVAARAAARYGELVRPVVVTGPGATVENWDGEHLVDPQGRVAAAYHADQRPLVLIRPDSHIGYHATGDDVKGLFEHLDRFLATATAAVG